MDKAPAFGKRPVDKKTSSDHVVLGNDPPEATVA